MGTALSLPCPEKIHSAGRWWPYSGQSCCCRSLGLAGAPRKTTVRTLVRLDVAEDGPLLVVTAVGDGFLRGMVCRLVGTLLEAGRGRGDPYDALVHPGPTAPARGLTLEKVFHPAG